MVIALKIPSYFIFRTTSNRSSEKGNTLGPEHRHWRRAKIGRRFRLFFRYDSRAKTIVFAWVNDEQTLRSAATWS